MIFHTFSLASWTVSLSSTAISTPPHCVSKESQTKDSEDLLTTAFQITDECHNAKQAWCALVVLALVRVAADLVCDITITNAAQPSGTPEHGGRILSSWITEWNLCHECRRSSGVSWIGFSKTNAGTEPDHQINESRRILFLAGLAPSFTLKMENTARRAATSMNHFSRRGRRELRIRNRSWLLTQMYDSYLI
jgi:hypothetical protein